MFRISKGCSSCWKLLQTCSSYRCGVMAAQNWQYHQNHRIIVQLQCPIAPKLRPHKRDGLQSPSFLLWFGASCVFIATCVQELQAPKHTPFAVFDSLVLPACKSYHHKMFRIRRLSTQTLDIGPRVFPLRASVGVTGHPKSTVSKHMAILRLPGWPHPLTFLYAKKGRRRG